MAQPKKRSDTVIVHELLAFLQNQLNFIDEHTLEQICALHYKEDDISAAKNVLQYSAKTSVCLALRRNKKKDLQDIIRVFKETNPDDTPTYVARDLHLLPSVAMDHDVISRLLRDIFQPRTELKAIRKEHLETEDSVDSQSENSSNENEGVHSLISSKPETPLYVSPIDAADSRGQDNAPESPEATEPTVSQSRSYSSPSLIHGALEKSSYQNSASSSKAQNTRSESSFSEQNATKNKDSFPLTDSDGFTLVENQKRHKESRTRNPKQDLIDKEQLALQNDLEITGVLEYDDENVTGVAMMVINWIEVPVDKRDIVYARRVGPAAMGNDADNRPRPIVIRLADHEFRNHVLSRVSAYGDGILSPFVGLRGFTPILVHERLTKENRLLFKKACTLCKEHNWKYTWTQDGKIFVREADGAPSFQVISEKDLKKLFK